MTSYQYKAYGPTGNLVEGSVGATNREQALKAVQRLGLSPFHVAVGGKPQVSSLSSVFRAKFKSKLDFARLFADLDVLLTAGFTIDRAIQTLLFEARLSHETKALKTVHERLASGGQLASSFQAIEGLTPSVLALLESAEGSGRIDTVIASLAKSYHQAAENRGAILQAIAYPLFLLCSMIGAFLVILFSLAPAIAPVFENGATSQNSVVSGLIFLHDLLSSNADFLAMVGVAGIATGAWLALTSRGRNLLLCAAMRLPHIGGLIRDGGTARYLETLATLLHNGVSMRKALNLSAGACPIPSFRDRLDAISNQVVSGGAFKQAAAAANLFDYTTLALIAVGDDASRLPHALDRAANLLFARAKQKMDRAVALLSPIMTITMGVMIGGLVLSIMSALLEINDAVLQ